MPGVQFAALVARLPQTVPDGDAALAAIWQRIAAVRTQPVLSDSELEQLSPLLEAIAAVARGNTTAQAANEVLLPQLETKGYRLTQPVQRIWAGERDLATLTCNLDPVDTALMRRILELLQR